MTDGVWIVAARLDPPVVLASATVRVAADVSGATAPLHFEAKRPWMGKNERIARWVEVEALCLCAHLERQFGAASSDGVRGVDAPGSVKLTALRILRHKAGWQGGPYASAARVVGGTLAAELVSIPP
jgi:hypothetical protein